MRIKRQLATASVIAAVTIITAVPARADTSVADVGVRMSSPMTDAPVSVLVTADVSQTRYADFSLDVTFEGFTARRGFAYRAGSCPASLFRLNIPAEVFECGWEQEGANARLRMAIRGTFSATEIGIRVKRSALMSPKDAGEFPIEVSSWAFTPASTTVEIKNRARS